MIGSYKVLPLRARVDLGAMTVKGYTAFTKGPALLVPYHHLVSYQDIRWGESYLCAEKQSVYSTTLADWVTRLWMVFLLCWEAVSVFYNPSRLGHSLVQGLTPQQKISRYILQHPQPTGHKITSSSKSVSASASSRHANSTDTFYCVTLSVLIGHHSCKNPLDGIQCSYRASECKFFLVCKYWCVHVWESTWQRHLWVRYYFPSSVQHVLLSFLGWFVRWEVSGRTR